MIADVQVSDSKADKYPTTPVRVVFPGKQMIELILAKRVGTPMGGQPGSSRVKVKKTC
jgi:hypothetical protein